MDQDCLPWMQLHTLRVRSLLGSEAFYYCGPVLERLANIRVLSLCVKEPITADPPIDLARLLMPFLEELETTVPFSPRCVLSLLTAPSLRTLMISPYIHGTFEALTPEWTYLPSFSSRSRCQIQSFSAGGGQFDPAVLANMPFLNSLSLYELSGHHITTLLSQLQGYDGSPACCPLLRQLLVTEAQIDDEIEECFYTEENLDLLARLLETRWRAAPASNSAIKQNSSSTKRLEEFALIALKPPGDDYLGIGEEQRRRIGVLEADGMSIHVSLQRADFPITDPLEVLHGRQLPPRHRVYPLGPFSSQMYL